MPRRRANPETAFMRMVEEFLALTGDFDMDRNNVGGFKKESGQYVKFGLQPGSPDLIGSRRSDGKYFGIEIKGDRGALRPSQRLWLAQRARSGVCLAVVRPKTFDRFREWIESRPQGGPGGHFDIPE